MSLVGATAVNGILSVTLRRPEKRNALSRELIAELAQAFSTWRDDEGWSSPC